SEPAAPVELYPQEIAGESSRDKCARMAAQLAGDKLDALVVSAPDCLAWLLNIRGNDVENCPFALGHAVLHASGQLELYMNGRKLGAEVKAALVARGAGAVRVFEHAEFVAAFAGLAQQRVRVDRSSASEWLIEAL